MMRLLATPVVLLSLVLAVSHAVADDTNYQRCEFSPPSDADYSDNTQLSCPFASMTQPTMIYPGGNSQCALGADYAFQVIPGQWSSRNKVHLHFQGGGACFNDVMCHFNNTYVKKPRIEAAGFFNTTDLRNPFRRWTTVVVQYCTGDVHIGNAKSTFLPYSKKTIHLNGLNNTEAVLSWVLTNFDTPSQLVISGSSAGALGLMVWAPKIIQSYRHMTDKLVFFADGYPGYMAEEIGRVTSFWGICDDPRVFSHNVPADQDLLAACNANLITMAAISARTHAIDRSIPFAYTASKVDQTQQRFYCFAKSVVTGVDFDPACIDQPTYYNAVKQVLRDYTAGGRTHCTNNTVSDPTCVNNVVSYLVNTPGHVSFNQRKILKMENSRRGPSMLEAVRYIVRMQGGQVSSTTIRSFCAAAPRTKYSISDLDDNDDESTIDLSCDRDITSAVFNKLSL